MMISSDQNLHNDQDHDQSQDQNKNNQTNNKNKNKKNPQKFPTAADLQAAQKPVEPFMQVFMAFDFGKRRIGVAMGNRLTQTATPQQTISANNPEHQFELIKKRLKEWQPDALVIGVPFHPDGQGHENTQKAQHFAKQLRERFHLSVFEIDERYSTTEAHSLSAKDADAISACIILEQFLRGLTS